MLDYRVQTKLKLLYSAVCVANLTGRVDEDRDLLIGCDGAHISVLKHLGDGITEMDVLMYHLSFSFLVLISLTRFDYSVLAGWH